MFRKLVMTLLILLVGAFQSNFLIAADKAEVEIYTLPFGTPSYLVDTAVESLYGELKDTNIKLKIKQTPGAFYIIRTFAGMQDKIASGAVPQAMVGTTDSILPYTIEGRPPFTKFPLPRSRVIWGTAGFLKVFVTFDKNIKTPADFVGKKVGFAEKARAFNSSIPNMPYFNKGYGGYNKVKWQHLGSVNSKDALLSGAIDVHWGTLLAKVAKDDQGRMVALYAVPAPPLMELMSAGRELYFVNEDPKITKAAYNPAKDQVLTPVFISAKSLKGSKHDFWARGQQGLMVGDATMPKEVAEELVLTVWKNMKRLSEYQAMFGLYGASPYPVNVPKKYVHPGLISATKKLGFKVPNN
jgi:TRAP-type uncharacterized transport system substrate-binding protein